MAYIGNELMTEFSYEILREGRRKVIGNIEETPRSYEIYS
jgi:hypothetical protein